MQAWRTGRFDEAERLLNAAAAAAETELLSDQPLAAILFDLGRLYSDWKRFDRAAEAHRKALALREQELGPSHASVAESLFHLAWAVWQSGGPREAERLLRRARPVAEASAGPDSPLVGGILTNLALLLAENGAEDDEEEESLLRLALQNAEARLGPDHPEVAAAVNNLANLHARRGEFDRAITLHRRALAVREAALPPDHPDVAESLGNLGRALMDGGRAGDAEPLLARAVQSLGDAGMTRAASLVNVLERLAELRRARKDYAGALPLLERALALQQRDLGPDHLEVAGTLNNLAGVYAGLGLYGQAEHVARRSLEIRRAALGAESPSVVQGLRNLAFVATVRGDLSEAEALSREALEIVGRRAGPEHPDAAAVMEQLARVLDRQGGEGDEAQAKTAEAADLRARAAAIRSQAAESDLFGP